MNIIIHIRILVCTYMHYHPIVKIDKGHLYISNAMIASISISECSSIKVYTVAQKCASKYRHVSAFIRSFAYSCILYDTFTRTLSATDVNDDSGDGDRSHIVCVLIYVAYRAFLLPRYRDLSAANYMFMPSPCLCLPSLSLAR